MWLGGENINSLRRRGAEIRITRDRHVSLAALALGIEKCAKWLAKMSSRRQRCKQASFSKYGVVKR